MIGQRSTWSGVSQPCSHKVITLQSLLLGSALLTPIGKPTSFGVKGLSSPVPSASNATTSSRMAAVAASTAGAQANWRGS